MIGAGGLIDLQNVKKENLLSFFHQVQSKDYAQFQARSGLVGCLGFFEPSTRTQISFEKAGLDLGVQWLKLFPENLSLKKGETLEETFEVLKSCEIDFYILRHSIEGFAHQAAKWTGRPVINAGDGVQNHPSQAISDVFCLWTQKPEKAWSVVFYGDILHSRVLRSNLQLMRVMGFEVAVCSSMTDEDKAFCEQHQLKSCSVDELQNFDIVYSLRVQTERGSKQVLEPLEPKMLGSAALMHAGPVIHGQDVGSGFDQLQDSAPLVFEQLRCLYRVRSQLLANLLKEL